MGSSVKEDWEEGLWRASGHLLGKYFLVTLNWQMKLRPGVNDRLLVRGPASESL